MILESLIGLSLIVNVSVVNVSVESGIKPAVGSAPIGMPVHQKSAAMQPLVRSATECILHTVASDPRAASWAQHEGQNQARQEAADVCSVGDSAALLSVSEARGTVEELKHYPDADHHISGDDRREDSKQDADRVVAEHHQVRGEHS